MGLDVAGTARSEKAGEAVSSHASLRQPAVDLAKALATWLIMLHHFSLYGPLADALHHAHPYAAHVLTRYGRYAVQVFLVLGGYLAAQSLMRSPPSGWHAWLMLVLQRWWRLVIPFLAAVGLTLLAHAATASQLPELLPRDINGWMLLAHGLLLHGLGGVESLTVGAWYVAIDFQLFVLVSTLFALKRVGMSAGALWSILVLLSLASLWIFNRNPALDDFALYFLGSYGLGAVVAGMQRWSSQEPRWRMAAALASLAVALALVIEWRGRLLWALATAWLLLVVQHRPWTGRVSRSHVWKILGERAFALFLVHFAVWLLANALFVAVDGKPADHGLAIALLGLACIVSCVAADVFFRWVERPASRLQWRLPSTSAGAS